MKLLPRIFAALITSFMGFCVIQSLNWHPRVHGWHPSWWQSEGLASIGHVFTFVATIPVLPVALLANAIYIKSGGYRIPNWVAYAVFYPSIVLELAGVAWASYRIGLWFLSFYNRPLRIEKED
jgi:hypothetical protein